MFKHVFAVNVGHTPIWKGPRLSQIELEVGRPVEKIDIHPFWLYIWSRTKIQSQWQMLQKFSDLLERALMATAYLPLPACLTNCRPETPSSARFDIISYWVHVRRVLESGLSQESPAERGAYLSIRQGLLPSGLCPDG
jgi:hypothetical protein